MFCRLGSDDDSRPVLVTVWLYEVHDELVLEVPEDEIVKVKLLVEEEMGRAVKTTVPLKVDISHGSNWSEAH